MTNIVIDTNVIISAVLSPAGSPAAIVSLVSGTETLQVFYSSAILMEHTSTGGILIRCAANLLEKKTHDF